MTFWRDYLIASQKPRNAADRKAANHVAFCPTDEWHRYLDLFRADDPDSELKPVLTGYFYLPGRINNGWPYDSEQLGPWHFRKKLGGEFGGAPVLIDRLQGVGTRTTSLYEGGLRWSTNLAGKVIPIPNHRGPGGAPVGGNFLFEDGHVEWVSGRKVSLGSSGGEWQCFYKVPIN
jgi:hypothetical protein